MLGDDPERSRPEQDWTALVEAAADAKAFAETFGACSERKALVMAHALGVQQMMVCINKIDKEDVDMDRMFFDAHCEALRVMLSAVGFAANKVPMIPVRISRRQRLRAVLT